MNWGLPTTVTLSGSEYKIRTDYRAILDICMALQDPELSNNEKCIAALEIFYIDYETIPRNDIEQALKECFLFMNCGKEEDGKKHPKLMDWEQDYQYIIAPINKVAGFEVRTVEYIHWWTFISYYYEIGESTFSQIVRIRDAKQRGKKLDKADREWYNRNRDIVDLRQKFKPDEDELIKLWTGGN